MTVHTLPLYCELADVAMVLMLEADVLESLEHIAHAQVLRRQADAIKECLVAIQIEPYAQGRDRLEALG